MIAKPTNISQFFDAVNRWQENEGANTDRRLVLHLLDKYSKIPLASASYVNGGSEGVVLYSGGNVLKITVMRTHFGGTFKHVAREVTIGIILSELKRAGLPVGEFFVATHAFGVWRAEQTQRVQVSPQVSIPPVPHGPIIDFTDLLSHDTARIVRGFFVGRNFKNDECIQAAIAYRMYMEQTYTEESEFVQVAIQEQQYAGGATLDTLLRKGDLLDVRKERVLLSYISLIMQMLNNLQQELGFMHMDLSTRNIMIKSMPRVAPLPQAYTKFFLMCDGKQRPFDLFHDLNNSVPVIIDLSVSVLDSKLISTMLPGVSFEHRNLLNASPFRSGAEDVRRLGLYLMHSIIARSARISRKVIEVALRMISFPRRWRSLANAKLVLQKNWTFKALTFREFLGHLLRIHVYGQVMLKAGPSLSELEHRLLASDVARRTVLASVDIVIHDLNPYMNALMMSYPELKVLDVPWLPSSVAKWPMFCV